MIIVSTNYDLIKLLFVFTPVLFSFHSHMSDKYRMLYVVWLHRRWPNWKKKPLLTQRLSYSIIQHHFTDFMRFKPDIEHLRWYILRQALGWISLAVKLWITISKLIQMKPNSIFCFLCQHVERIRCRTWNLDFVYSLVTGNQIRRRI